MDVNKHVYVLSDVRDLMIEKFKEKQTGDNMFPFLFRFIKTIS